MAVQDSRLFVVDASVARASGGEDAAFPTSRNCRDFLKAILDICHRVALPTSIRAEWRQNRSGFANTWLVQMFARKKVVLSDVPADGNFRQRVNASDLSEVEKRNAIKDCHLIESAWSADKVVVSLDEEAKGLFSRLVAAEARLGAVIWVNPDRNAQDQIAWLANGAPEENGKTLNS